MSARRGAEWRRNGFRFIADRPRPLPRTALPDCPAGFARVAIFTPDGHLSQAVFAELIDGKAVVTVLGERMKAEPCAPIPEASNARYRVTMPPRGEEP